MPASEGEVMREYLRKAVFTLDASSGNISSVQEVPYREPPLWFLKVNFFVVESKLFTGLSFNTDPILLKTSLM